MPASYDGLYYDAPGYDYRYFDGGIYQIEPETRIVVASGRLLTGHTSASARRCRWATTSTTCPTPIASRYYDRPDAWYRYADGHIYQVDPQTRLIQAVIDAIV